MVSQHNQRGHDGSGDSWKLDYQSGCFQARNDDSCAKRGENAKEEGFCWMKRRLELQVLDQVVFCCLLWGCKLYFEVWVLYWRLEIWTGSAEKEMGMSTLHDEGRTHHAVCVFVLPLALGFTLVIKVNVLSRFFYAVFCLLTYAP